MYLHGRYVDGFTIAAAAATTTTTNCHHSDCGDNCLSSRIGCDCNFPFLVEELTGHMEQLMRDRGAHPSGGTLVGFMTYF
jgi:hypothetical protein